LNAKNPVSDKNSRFFREILTQGFDTSATRW